jgi:hypothetical protein
MAGAVSAGPAARVLVVGSPGAGKSTLTRGLARGSDLPVRHLDDEYWGPGWTRPDRAGWIRHQHTLTRADRWIIDGNHLPTMPLRAARASLVVLVDAVTATCLARVLRRALEVRRGRYASLPGRVRAEVESGRPVRATRDFLPLLRLVARFRRRDRWQVVAVARAAPAARLVVAVVPGRWGDRVGRVRRRLARRGIGDADVLAVSAVAGLLGGGAT